MKSYYGKTRPKCDKPTIDSFASYELRKKEVTIHLVIEALPSKRINDDELVSLHSINAMLTLDEAKRLVKELTDLVESSERKLVTGEWDK